MILANNVGKVKVTYVTDPIVDTHLMSIFNLIIAEKLGLVYQHDVLLVYYTTLLWQDHDKSKQLLHKPSSRDVTPIFALQGCCNNLPGKYILTS